MRSIHYNKCNILNEWTSTPVVIQEVLYYALDDLSLCRTVHLRIYGAI